MRWGLICHLLFLLLAGCQADVSHRSASSAAETWVRVPQLPEAVAAGEIPHEPLHALLINSEGPGPSPAIILMHGCSGWDKNYANETFRLQRDYGRRHALHGRVALVLDSFSARGIREACSSADWTAYSFSVRRHWDAYAAARYLIGLGYVNPQKIVVEGLSDGGRTVINAIANPPSVPEKLAGAIAWYPSSAFTGERLSAPLLVFYGGRDDWTPKEATEFSGKQFDNWEQLARRITYPDATHAYDFPISPRTFHGHHMKYDQAATANSLAQIDAFLRDLGLDR